jgi:hypothetical protein
MLNSVSYNIIHTYNNGPCQSQLLREIIQNHYTVTVLIHIRGKSQKCSRETAIIYNVLFKILRTSKSERSVMVIQYCICLSVCMYEEGEII